MQFETQLKRARITYAVIMAGGTCILMSAISTCILRPLADFWQVWPHLVGIDLCVAIPVGIAFGPLVRRICYKLYPEIAQ